MSETKHDFLLDLYVTEAFDVVTREGLPVSIGAINTLIERGRLMVGFLITILAGQFNIYGKTKTYSQFNSRSTL